jgi:hypothetical protein
MFGDKLVSSGLLIYGDRNWEGNDMQSSGELRVLPQADSDQFSWMALLKSNCAALFQTALLLSADPQIAEASIAVTIDNLDISKAPRQDESSSLQKTVAMHTLRIQETASFSRTVEAQPMLQSGLWPILQLEKFVRACFVLRFLLGYSTSCCAQIIGIEQAAVEASLDTALLQLQQANPLKTDGNFNSDDKTHSGATWPTCPKRLKLKYRRSSAQ